MSSTTTSGITRLNLVIVPTADQDRSIAFYVDVLGFEKRTDIPMGDDYRWVEVYAPEGETGIALAPPPPGSDAAARETGITLATADIDATRAHLVANGVDADEVSRMGDPVPPLFSFRDPDGHSLMVVQPA
jgi:catechol 2,3-dioxygenase-like lactoylglutathione lyase family enzyme